jgi:hypothetical protein
MVWFKIDDGFPNSKPVLRIPRRHRASAIGLWTLAGAWSAKELTDGHIAEHLIEEFASTPAMARNLVACGLWEEGENGWNFRNWGKWQPTREQVEADREREAERKRSYRASKRSPSGTTPGQTVGHQAESGHPDPTRPDPTYIREAPADATPTTKAKNKTPVPAKFKPNDNHREKAKALNLDADVEVEKFVDWHLAKGTKNLSWDAAFSNWLRKADEFRTKSGPTSPVSHLRPVEDIEEPPPFLSPDEYEEWRRAKPGRR